MNKILLILILSFSFQTLTKADDISDFEIEGMGIGDSLLNFYNKKEILVNKVDWYDLREKNRYLSFAFGENDFKKYDFVDIWTIYNDENYKIEGVAGSIYFGENADFKNINDCYAKQNEVANQISKLFKNTPKKGPIKIIHNADKTKNSTYTDFYFYFGDNHNITISCYDWSKKMEDENNRKDHFSIFIRSNELDTWLD
jgi:hypothetical protein